jgi:hypothetical protein
MPDALPVPDQTTQIFTATLLLAVGTGTDLMRIGDERLGCGANPPSCPFAARWPGLRERG